MANHQKIKIFIYNFKVIYYDSRIYTTTPLIEIKTMPFRLVNILNFKREFVISFCVTCLVECLKDLGISGDSDVLSCL